MGPHETLIRSYFDACSNGTAEDIASHFTADAVIYDTNVAPFRGAAAIGEMWTKVRAKWGGARWAVDSCIESEVKQGEPIGVAAIEWSMHGTDPKDGRAFVFRGSEHYRIEHRNLADAKPNGRIAEIRQYWTFDRTKLDSALVEYPYIDAHASDSERNSAVAKL